ncbi:LYR motif-containing protein 2 isoform X2 [Phycodurus eques]|uniref:LYR motif-containing protein 2 isoform X2 n=1 Tax=Phycodurus eques TaxID=693459 RepID=UPI002ACDA183|nr:LYR motif-containing protein 2 isoform X2 [Phycodurus eques]
MAAPRIPSTALSLKRFLQRQNVLGIYRNMLRTIRYVPDETDRKYLRDWAREEFKRNKNATDQVLSRVPLLTPPSAFLRAPVGSGIVGTRTGKPRESLDTTRRRKASTDV